MTPFEMLSVLDDAIAAAPRGRRAIALELHTRGGQVLGVHGKHMGSDEGGPVFGFTRRQCEEIRGLILAAAAADGVDPGYEHAEMDYTGDHV